MDDGEKQLELELEKQELLSCLMSPIVIWKGENRLEEACQGILTTVEENDYKNYKEYVKKILKRLYNKVIGNKLIRILGEKDGRDSD